MDVKMIEYRLKSNGIILTETDGIYSFKPIKTNPNRYILLALLVIPNTSIFLFILGFSILGFIVFALGISALIQGVRSYKEAKDFNNQFLTINQNELLTPFYKVPIKDVIKVKSNLSKNYVYPNLDITVETVKADIKILRIWNKRSKFIDDDRHRIVKYLTSILNTNT